MMPSTSAAYTTGAPDPDSSSNPFGGDQILANHTQRGPLYLRPSGSCEHVATFLTLTPIVRVARVPLHPRESFRVQTAAVGAGRRRGVRGRRGNRVRGRNETGARLLHDALQWLMCT